jgi:Fur family transcriptional regulator, ferric uptake regulator
MTLAPDVPRLVVETPDEAVRTLRAAGLRLSTARRLIIDGLFAADGPVSAQGLARTLSLEESSVYRNLELLERQGLTRHVHLGHGAGLYALVGRDEGEYLYCEACGTVTQVGPDALAPVRDHILRELGHTVRFTHFALVGLCERCAAADAPAPSDRHHHE